MIKLPKRRKNSHKGDYGHVLVLAGSKGFTGAAYLASQAAILSGSGLVTLGIPESLNPVMARKLTEVMTLPLPETKEATLSLRAFGKIKDFLKRVVAVAIGPGLSRNPETAALVRKITAIMDKPLILDADGINAFAGRAGTLKKIRILAVITPHEGEMARLLKIKAGDIRKKRLATAKKAARHFKKTILLKGYKTIIASPDGRCYINTTGNPGMASGGTGDVLTGIIAGLLGQGMEPFTAAKVGAYVHGLAGDIAKKEKGEASLIATDLLNKLPEAFKRISG